ncbi:Zn(II)2Cys6 transcription factor domain-containing protein [Aspergillus lucknowensis]|uniref:Zn(2)-C6 fungal-type domain-containing protein n=1 Tax=Aspergillus lucknowensis TaxID=176173 RepID=A0ABR4M1R5_9EURO
MIVQKRRTRHGARGARKVKTGCLTCKTRHKKCDERRPECLRCTKAGWRCDFVTLAPSSRLMTSHRDQPRDGETSSPLSISSLTLHDQPAQLLLTEVELIHMEYFHRICAKEFALFFDLPAWENLILQQTRQEVFLHHAGLAIGALSRSRYHPSTTTAGPTSSSLGPQSPTLFSIRQYGLAMQELHSRLHGGLSGQRLELAALASVVFSQIEFLLGIDSQLEVHLRAGGAVLRALQRREGCGMPSMSVSGNQGSNRSEGEDLAPCNSYNILANAIGQLSAQVDSLKRFRRARL